jgi:hypothetical protein
MDSITGFVLVCVILLFGFLGIVIGGVAYGNQIQNSNISSAKTILQYENFTILNGTTDSPVVTVTMPTVNALIQQAEQLNTTTIYHVNAGTNQEGFLVLDSSNIGYEYQIGPYFWVWNFGN